MGALAAAVLALPAQPLLLDGSTLGFRPDMLTPRGSTMGLADRVATDDEGNRLLVVHGHAGKGLADVLGGRERIGVAPGPFGVHVDQAHLHGAERVVKFPVAAIALVSKPVSSGPQKTSSGSQTSGRPKPKPNVLKPIDS